MKLTDKMEGICISGKLSVQEPSEWEFFAYLWVILLYFSLESRMIPAVVELGQVVLKIWLGQQFDSCQTAVKFEFESLF